MSAHIPPSDDSESPLHSYEGESLIERAIRQSFAEREASLEPRTEGFSEDEHLAIAKSGAADLSTQEHEELLKRVSKQPRIPYGERTSRPIPLFFGSWSGMNPFRFLKPFFLQKKRGSR